MPSTRGAAASSSVRAKQLLVHHLFGQEQFRCTPISSEAHRTLDHSHYTYSDLRQAYLQRVHQIHPDRYHTNNSNEREHAKHEFVKLQDAWALYESFAKELKSGDVDASFTMFGVGCSFSDNDAERALRAEITDQACRGWFSSGALNAGGDDEKTASKQTTNKLQHAITRLADDDLFVQDDDSGGWNGSRSSMKAQLDDSHKAAQDRPRPSLVAYNMRRK